MGKIARIYAKAVRKNFKVLFANWAPGNPISLGDYGPLQDDIFIPMGNLKQDFKEFKGNGLKIINDPSPDQKEFKSAQGIDVNISPQVEISVQGTPMAKVDLDIRFKTSKAVYFKANECTTSRIANKAMVGEKIVELAKAGRWNEDYYVVTDVVEAQSAIVAISNSSNAGIVIEATSPALNQINLGNASAQFKVTSEKDIGFKLVANKGMILLLGLCTLEKKGFMPKSKLFKRSASGGGLLGRSFVPHIGITEAESPMELDFLEPSMPDLDTLADELAELELMQDTSENFDFIQVGENA